VPDGAIRANATSNQMDHLHFVGDAEDGFEPFKNFELELFARGQPNSNSGIFIHTDLTTPSHRLYLNTGHEIQLKKSLESDYPRPEAMALRPIHGFATAISTAFSGRAECL
jgi:hypothetical protein